MTLSSGPEQQAGQAGLKAVEKMPAAQDEPERELFTLGFHDPLTRTPVFYGMPGFNKAIEELLKTRPPDGEPSWVWAYLEGLAEDRKTGDVVASHR